MVQAGRQLSQPEDNLLFEEEPTQQMNLGSEEDIIQDQINSEELRRIKVPAHRMNPLKTAWDQIVALMT